MRDGKRAGPETERDSAMKANRNEVHKLGGKVEAAMREGNFKRANAMARAARKAQRKER